MAGTITIACGVTTAPRAEPTIDATLAGLRASGFDPAIFADVKRNAFRNWLSALATLAEANGRYVMLAQDDIQICHGVRQYVESLDWPADCGCLSLYTPGRVNIRGEGLQPCRSGKTWGACCLIFPVDVARRIVAHPLASTWKDRQIDVFTGRVLERLRLRFYYHVPSLVQHVGAVSAFGDGRKMGSHRRARDWPGDEFDAATHLEARRGA